MEPLTVVLDATSDGLPGMGDLLFDGRITAVGGIPEGTEGGLAAVGVMVTLEDGRTVLGQTTLALLTSATRALNARYPDDRP